MAANAGGRLARGGRLGTGDALEPIRGWLAPRAHGHLFGLKQVHEHLQGDELSAPAFQIRGYYRYVRHPLNLGFLIAFWATPEMTVGHLVFALATTGYIFVAMVLEERDLIARFGERYRQYRERVPMIVPWPAGSRTRKQKSRA